MDNLIIMSKLKSRTQLNQTIIYHLNITLWHSQGQIHLQTADQTIHILALLYILRQLELIRLPLELVITGHDVRVTGQVDPRMHVMTVSESFHYLLAVHFLV